MFIYEEMESLWFKVDTKSFYQIHLQQVYVLYKAVRDFATLSGGEVFYNLRTGIGTIERFVTSQAQKAIGLKSGPEAVALARENALLNTIDNHTFFCGDMKEIFTSDFIEIQDCYDVVITDPPREGIHKKFMYILL
ncbi:MAG: hypothetical protein ABI045_04775 [Flavobacteriales bacterium]